MLARPRQRQRFRGNTASLALLANLAYGVDLRTNTLPDGLTFSRASAATDIINGVLTSFASGSPRISVANGYLPENQATNYVYPSIPSASGTWAYTGVSGTVNYAASPDGSSNATLLQETGSTSTTHMCLQSPDAVQYVSGSVYTGSTFAKADSASVVQLWTGAAIGGYYANFDLQNGVVGTTNATSSKIEYVGGGWYRCSMVFTATSTATASLGIALTNNNSGATGRLPIYIPSGLRLFVYGAQLEAGPKATSYIPTTTSAATRAADVLYKDMTGIANTSEGTLFVQVRDAEGATVVPKYLAQIQGTGNNNIVMFLNITNFTDAQAVSNGALAEIIGSVAYTGGRLKHAIGYALNDVNAAANGVLGTKDTSAAMPLSLTTMYIGQRVDLLRGLGGYVEAVRYYNKRKTDAELQAMTAL